MVAHAPVAVEQRIGKALWWGLFGTVAGALVEAPGKGAAVGAMLSFVPMLRDPCPESYRGHLVVKLASGQVHVPTYRKTFPTWAVAKAWLDAHVARELAPPKAEPVSAEDADKAGLGDLGEFGGPREWLRMPPARFRRRARRWGRRRRQVARNKLNRRLQHTVGRVARERHTPGFNLQRAERRVGRIRERLEILNELGDAFGATSSIPTGIFGPDGGYYYSYGRDGTVKYAHPASGTWWVTVPSRTSQKKAILAKLRSGDLDQLTQSQIKAKGLSRRSRANFPTRSPYRPAPTASTPSAPVPGDKPWMQILSAFTTAATQIPGAVQAAQMAPDAPGSTDYGPAPAPAPAPEPSGGMPGWVKPVGLGLLIGLPVLGGVMLVTRRRSAPPPGYY